ncbi:hypothetical protein NBRC106471_0171 [Acetobacter pasteurianus subsp. pasteurianus LMG 1262 = NBRC 106471]|nr:hypothetical protein NBRC106471_0171 [Acetobacter pasteurianus subsp. pasteurianus LMG 1262 = NBRC 106471]
MTYKKFKCYAMIGRSLLHYRLSDFFAFTLEVENTTHMFKMNRSHFYKVIDEKGFQSA